MLHFPKSMPSQYAATHVAIVSLTYVPHSNVRKAQCCETVGMNSRSFPSLVYNVRPLSPVPASVQQYCTKLSSLKRLQSNDIRINQEMKV